MSLTATTLNGAITQNAVKVTLTSATGAAVNNLLLIDGEYMRITDISLTPTLGVARGMNGTLAIAHNTLAPAIFGPTGDFVTVTVGAPVTSYSVDGAITVPTVDGTIFVNKAGVCALTLAAPGKDQQNRVLIQSLSAQAHTVTQTTPGFNSGSTAADVATFGGAIGDSFVIQAEAGAWNVVSLHNVTLG